MTYLRMDLMSDLVELIQVEFVMWVVVVKFLAIGRLAPLFTHQQYYITINSIITYFKLCHISPTAFVAHHLLPMPSTAWPDLCLAKL